jgi:hypothetical protein
MVGPWQVPVADCAVTLSAHAGYTGEAMSMGERTPLALIDAAASARMAVAESITKLDSARIGKLGDVKLSANWMAAAGSPGEDDFARATLQDYAAFLYTVPWFKYPFREKLDGLMAITTPTPNIPRTWERGFALGAEYFVKIGYASLIQKLLDASGDDTPRDIMFVTATLPTDTLAKEPRIKPIRTLTPEWQLVQTPRYKDFTEILRGLLDQGIGIAEIAGNREIFITVIAPDAAKLDVKDTAELFSLRLDAKPGFRRAGLKARIDRLVEINRDLKAKGVSIEHFYDY